MGLSPYATDVVDMAEQDQVRNFAPCVEQIIRNRRRIKRVGSAGEQKANRNAASGQYLMGADQSPHALAIDQSADKGHRDDEIGGFGKRRERIDVDARAGNHRNAVARHAEPCDDGPVVGVLHEYRAIAPLQQPTEKHAGE